MPWTLIKIYITTVFDHLEVHLIFRWNSLQYHSCLDLEWSKMVRLYTISTWHLASKPNICHYCLVVLSLQVCHRNTTPTCNSYIFSWTTFLLQKRNYFINISNLEPEKWCWPIFRIQLKVTQPCVSVVSKHIPVKVKSHKLLRKTIFAKLLIKYLVSRVWFGTCQSSQNQYSEFAAIV